jgi:hypothetical protein
MYFSLWPLLAAACASATALTYKLNAHEKACFYTDVTQQGSKVAFYFAVRLPNYVQSHASKRESYVIMTMKKWLCLDDLGERTERLTAERFTGPIWWLL